MPDCNLVMKTLVITDLWPMLVCYLYFLFVTAKCNMNVWHYILINSLQWMVAWRNCMFLFWTLIKYFHDIETKPPAHCVSDMSFTNVLGMALTISSDCKVTKFSTAQNRALPSSLHRWSMLGFFASGMLVFSRSCWKF